MIPLLRLITIWPAGQPGVDIDLCSLDGAVKVVNIIPEDLVGLSSIAYLKSVLEEIVQ